MFQNQNDEAKQHIIEDILKNLPSENIIEVELPSENKAYRLEDPGSPITLRAMTFEDEKSIANAGANENPVNIILGRCLTNIKVLDLLPMDKIYLLLKLREISYGDEYKTLLICSHCKAENPTTVNLSELNVNPVPDDFCDPIEVFLPGIQKNAKVKLPRVRDERIISDTETFMEQLWRFVSEIDGHSDKAIVAQVVQKLPLKDIKTIINAFKTDYGVDTRIKMQCNKCGGVSVLDLPFDANFFNVN